MEETMPMSQNVAILVVWIMCVAILLYLEGGCAHSKAKVRSKVEVSQVLPRNVNEGIVAEVICCFVAMRDL